MKVGTKAKVKPGSDSDLAGTYVHTVSSPRSEKGRKVVDVVDASSERFTFPLDELRKVEDHFQSDTDQMGIPGL